ncbi:MAG TPA: HEAT repeat domain-containing protein [bacterium]|nr:HEAT repeat domain-containing protein [bacterium]
MTLKLPHLGPHNENPTPPAGKTDRLSQMLFGAHGESRQWEALDALALSPPSAWNQRLILWTLASPNPSLRERAWEILNTQSIDFGLLLQELSSPLWEVREGVVRLIAQTGRLDAIPYLITEIEEYHPGVAEAARRGMSVLIENAKVRQLNGGLPPEEAKEALEILFQSLYTSKRSPRFQTIQYLFQISSLDEDTFWRMYLNLELPQYTILHEEFLHYQKEGALRVLYRGLLQKNDLVLDRLTAFLALAVRNSGENVNYHLAALRSLIRVEFVKVAFVLQHYRILAEFQGLIKFMSPPERIVLFDLLEAVGAEQNLAFLLRCLQLDDSRIRIRVLKILGDNQNLGLRPEVFEFLTDTDEQMLLAALRYLQKKGDLSILERISHLARSKKKKVRQGVISTMFKIMKDNLLKRFDQFSSRQRLKILQSLLKMKTNFFEDLKYLSESPQEKERIKYIKMLEAQDIQEALADYHRLSRDPNPRVRATALMGFGRIKELETRFKMIQPFFDDPDDRVRANAVDLLPDQKPADETMTAIAHDSVRTGSRRERANAIAKLINWGYSEYEINLLEMLNSPDEITKTNGLWILGVTDLPHLIVYLRESANDPRPHVRQMAVRGIGLKGTDEDIRALMPYLKDPDRSVRVAAKNALRARLNLSFEIA